MLLSLSISNFAVFENVTINFDLGFNVFTGETGSGKSILIEAMGLILGERASKDLIRKGKKSALIEGIFDIGDNENIHSHLNSLNIEIDKEDYLIISREILDNGKSISKINGRVVPLSTLKSIGVFLIDIYSQFGHESLFKKENHIKMLDSLIEKDLSPIFKEYSKLFNRYIQVCNEINNLEIKLLNKESKIEQLNYEINEIDEAELKENEEEKLLKEIKKLSNVQEIKKSLYEALRLINSDDLNNVYSILNKIQGFDEKLESFLSRLDIQLEEIKLLGYDLRDYYDELDLDERQLSNIENRMSLINRLKRKYGFSIEKIKEYRESASEELSLLLEADNKLNSLLKEKASLYNTLKEKAALISKKRKDASEYLEKQLLVELNDLNMKNIKFKVNIEKKDLGADGWDNVEFLISTNVGSDLYSVQKIVSGGEASRIMLAFKKIKSDIGQTMVFDEIDTGISGKTAQMAGIKMKYIAMNNQVICVTHSPQIASIPKTHFLIEKNTVDNNTYSTVKKLDYEKRVLEIARLLSGMKITDKSLNNAKELIEFNKNTVE
ncbi:MAG TPA: DNA repair protein RecN [Tissierellia bacterium]|nr:DNA repair protein RecN [Tissierellia bacterium]